MLIIFLPACSHMAEKKKIDNLEATQKLFWKSLRWKSYDSAAGLIRFKNPARKLASIEGLNKITVTNYELVSTAAVTEDGVVTTHVVFDYVQNDTGRVYQIIHQENWWYEEASQRWYLASDMPDFKY